MGSERSSGNVPTHQEIARKIREEMPPIVKWAPRTTFAVAKQMFVARADADGWSEEESILAGAVIGVGDNALDAAEAWRPWAQCAYHDDGNVHAGCDLCAVASAARDALAHLDITKKKEGEAQHQ